MKVPEHPAEESHERRAAVLRALKKAVPLLVLAIFALAVWLLERELGESELSDTLAYVRALPPANLTAAGVLAFLSYVTLIGYDLLALAYAGAKLPLETVARTSFIASALANNLGFGTLTGGSVRYRSYAAAGLNGYQTTAVIGFHALTLPLGVTLLGGVTLILTPGMLAQYLSIPTGLVRMLGAVLVAPALAWVVLAGLRKRAFNVGPWGVQIPSLRIAVAQIAVSSFDLILAAAALYTLLPNGESPLTFGGFLTAYVTALTAAVLSHVPAGLGVFEGLVVSFTAASLPAHQILGALLLYRLIYYVAPLALAIVWFGLAEYAVHRQRLSVLGQAAVQHLSLFAPLLSAAAVFVAGAALLLFRAAPPTPGALESVNAWLPVGLIEGSHLLASLVGLGLILLAGSLVRRIDAAYYATLALLMSGIVLSLAQGLHYRMALGLAVVTLVLLPARQAFYRHAAFLQLRFSRRWTMAALVAVAGSIWIGFFAHRYVEYTSELWWQFELDDNAPRFLRTSLLLVVALTLVSLRQLLQPSFRLPSRPTATDLEKAAAIVRRSPDSSANLALLGDKSLMFSDSGDAFIMYRVQGNTWVALGDPVGPLSEHAELLWRFREMSDLFGGRCAFYQVKAENLSTYTDMGLALYKLGDEAHVDLTAFTLDLPSSRDLRQFHRRAAREGAVFQLLKAHEVAGVLPRLRQVSDAWLDHKAGAEKGFSLGFFHEAYLALNPCGVVKVNGEIVAFANIWTAADNSEISIDLMRHTETQVHGLMDFLIVEIMLWGKAQGYRAFNLGMAPLSGLETRRLGPLWHKLGARIYRMGEQFYGFRGLRRYKEKFSPRWRPKYLACSGGFAMARAMVDIIALVSGKVSLGTVTRKPQS